MKKIIKAFFHNSDGDFVAPYAWITVLMILVVIAGVIKIFDLRQISDTFVLGLYGLVASWLVIYNQYKGK